MLCTRVTEDVIVITTGFILFFIANHSFDDSYMRKQGESEKEKRYRSGQIIFIRKASIGAPDATM